jgi:hypothetical protein
MKIRRAAMQGEKTHDGLQPMKGLRGESSHKAASGGKSSNMRARLVVCVKVDGITAKTKIAIGD